MTETDAERLTRIARDWFLTRTISAGDDEWLFALARRGAEAQWRTMETAPRNGTAFLARIPGHGEDNILAWMDGLRNSEDQGCGGWAFVEDQECPDDWTDGICWEVNEDGKPSTQPTHWQPLTPPGDTE